jgi:molecular chaperone DnaK
MPEAPVREPVGPPTESGDKRRRVLVAASGVIVLAVLAALAVGLNVFGGPEEGSENQRTAGSSGDTSSATDSLPADEQCTEEIMSNPRWVCLTSAVVADGKLTIAYRGDGAAFDLNGVHLHLYGSDGTNPPDRIMGRQVPESEQGQWYAEARSPAVLALSDERVGAAIGDAKKVCARIADAEQNLVQDANGTYATGNCVPITRADTGTTPVTEQQGNGGDDGGDDGGGNQWPTTEETTDEPTTDAPTDDVPTDDQPTAPPTAEGGEVPAGG